MRFNSFFFALLFIGLSHTIFGQLRLMEVRATSYFDLSTNTIVKNKELAFQLPAIQSDKDALAKATFEQHLHSKKNKYRFNWQLIECPDPRFVNTGTDNLSLVRQGFQPYYYNPTVQYSLGEQALFLLARGILNNL
ncbi:MAG: hypothetical protein AAGA77_16195 [Bacteroidota bacterium]